MNDVEFQKLLEISWQRPLTSAEQARLEGWFAQHPHAQRQWEQESGLNHLLSQLQDAPVPSNFTRQILQAIPQEQTGSTAAFSWPEWFRRWRPRLAAAALLIALSIAGVRLNQWKNQKELAADLRWISSLALVPHPEDLRDFETIHRLSSVPPVQLVDMELLAALE